MKFYYHKQINVYEHSFRCDEMLYGAFCKYAEYHEKTPAQALREICDNYVSGYTPGSFTQYMVRHMLLAVVDPKWW